MIDVRLPDSAFRVPVPRSRSTRRLIAALVIACATMAGCGKKGPPLAPIVRVPAAVEKIEARRVGSDVYVTLTVPVRNIDNTMPADVDRIEVYGFTATAPPPRARFLEGGTLVATIPVAPPVLDNGTEVASPEVLARPGQGAVATIRDTLTPEQLTPRVLPPQPVRRGTSAAPVAQPQPAPGRLTRYYMALAFSDRGRPGPPGMMAELPLPALPDPPADVRVAYDPQSWTISWSASGGLLGFLLDRALPIEPPPIDEIAPTAAPQDVVPGAARYNVYRDVSPDPLALPPPAAQAWRQAPPAPLNPAPLDMLAWSTEVSLDDREYCFSVRAVRGTPPDAVEGDPSPPACTRAVDVFPPDPPTGLSAASVDGAISLIWDPSFEPDVAGYVILRGKAGDDTLTPITQTPIPEARYTDRQVEPGVRYVYAVVASDNRVPLPNMSAESARVEETAR